MGPVTVLTSVYGAYDRVPAPPEQTIPVDWVCVTDEPSSIPAPWVTVHEARPHLHPRMAAKLARCRPDLYTTSPVTVWLDAAARVKTRDSIETLVDLLDGYDQAQWFHPERQTIEAEAEVSAAMRKYHGQPMRQQCAHYRTLGLVDGGLWATGCIVRRRTPQTARAGDLWLQEMFRWGWQDQLSLPFALWMTDLIPRRLPHTLWSNPLIEFSYQSRSSDA
jgi:hypothetical protein